MRNLMMTTILALAAGPLWADNVALVLGNERYDRLNRVVQGDDVAAGAIALTRNGMRVYSTLNADADDMRAQAMDFVQDRADVTGQVAVLSGRFVTDGARTWFLGRDAVAPTIFAAGDQAILLETLLEVLAQTPGQSLLVLGRNEGATDDLGGGLREGIGDAPGWEYHPTSPPLVMRDRVVIGALVARLGGIAVGGRLLGDRLGVVGRVQHDGREHDA